MLLATHLIVAVLAVTVPGGDLYEQAHIAETKARYADAANLYATCADVPGPLTQYARVRAAVCRATAGDAAGGARALDEIIGAASGPWVALAAHERALLFARSGARAEAATMFMRAHKAPTDLWWLEDVRWVAAENALLLPGQQSAAVEFFKAEARGSVWSKKRYEAAKLLASTPSVEDRLAAVLVLVNAGASNEAEPLLDTITIAESASRELRNLRQRAQGRVDIARGREQGEVLLWELGVNPAAGELGRDALLDLVNHHARLKEFAESERVIARLVALNSASPQTLAAHKSLGMAYVNAERPEDAEVHFSAVAAQSSDPREVQTALLAAGNGFRMQGRAREALERFNAVLVRFPASESGVEAAYWAGALLHEAGGEKALVLQHFRSAASHGVSNYYGHRAADILAQLGDNETAIGRPLRITPKESILRPIKLDHDDPDGRFATVENDARVIRLAFFAPRGYIEGEWEALGLANDLSAMPDGEAYYLAMGEAGATAYTAMQLAAAAKYGDNADGSQTLTRLRIRYPRAYWDTVIKLSRAVDVDPYLVLAIARQESTYRPALTSVAGATGVMQLMPATAKWLVKQNPSIPQDAANELTVPTSSLNLGTHYLRMMLDKYDNNVVYALAAYNGGPGNCDAWRRNFKGTSFADFIERIPFTETRNYVKRVLANYVTYHSIYPTSR